LLARIVIAVTWQCDFKQPDTGLATFSKPHTDGLCSTLKKENFRSVKLSDAHRRTHDLFYF
jgi:hypothetical protein